MNHQLSNAPISPTDLRDFLSKAFGWTLNKKGTEHRLYVHEHASFAGRQLVFPMDEFAPDYTESVLRVFDKLADLLKISPEQLQARAVVAKEDVLRFRVFSARDELALPLSFASTLIKAAEKLLKAAACMTLDPKLHYPRLAHNDAQALIEKMRFNQTEKGSFILKLSCPIDALNIQKTLPLGLVPNADDTSYFVRNVNYTLKNALSELVSAIETDSLDQLYDTLKGTEPPLISTNLCEALTEMYSEDLQNALDIGFDWSMAQAVPAKLSLQSNIVFQRDYFRRIEDFGRSLRPSANHEVNTFIGTVEQLNGAMQEDGKRAGDVILALFHEGETFRARATLNANNYAEAIQAHQSDNAYVQIKGRLNAGRQPRQLDEVQQFELIKRS